MVPVLKCFSVQPHSAYLIIFLVEWSSGILHIDGFCLTMADQRFTGTYLWCHQMIAELEDNNDTSRYHNHLHWQCCWLHCCSLLQKNCYLKEDMNLVHSWKKKEKKGADSIDEACYRKIIIKRECLQSNLIVLVYFVTDI